MARLGGDNQVDILIKSKADNKAIDSTVSSLGQLESKSGIGGKALAAFGSAGRVAATGLAVAGAAVGAVGGSFVKSAANMEMLRSSFDTLLGSTEKGGKLFGDLSKMAKFTPFETGDLASASQTLLAFGGNVNDLIPELKMLGDISLGNRQKFSQLSLVFGQIRSNGKLMGQDLLQLVNVGFNPLQKMSERTGESMTSLRKKMENGQITFDMVKKEFELATQKGGAFFGGMDKGAKTLTGLWSTVRDSVGMTGRQLVGLSETGDIVKGGLFDKIKTAVELAIPVIEKLPKIISVGFDKIKPYMPSIAGAIIGVLIPAFVFLGSTIWAALAPLLPFIAAGAALGFMADRVAKKLGGWKKVFEDVKLAFDVFIQAFKDPDVTSVGWVGTVEKIASTVRYLFDDAKLAIDVFFKTLKNPGISQPGWVGVVQAAATAVRGAFEGLKDAAVGVWNGIKDAVGFLMPSLEALWSTIKNELIPVFQEFWKEHGDTVISMLKVLGQVATFLAKILGGVLVGAIWIVINVINGLLNIWKIWIGLVSSAINFITAFVNGAITKFNEFMAFTKPFWDAWVSIVRTAFVIVVTIVATYISIVQAIVRPIYKFFMWAFTGFINGVIGAWSKFFGFWNSVVNNIRKAVSPITDVLKAPFQKAWDWIKELPNRILGTVKSVNDTVRNAIGDWDIPGPLGKVRDVVPGFAAGGFTGRGNAGDIAGVVHKGEYVIPKSQVDQSTGRPKIMESNNSSVNIYGNITLGSSDAVDRWFARLDRNNELARKGLTTMKGAF